LHVFSPSFELACRRSPQQHFAQRRGKSQLSELVVWGAVAHRFSLAKANSLAQARIVATV
jgi:hypothetical protein